VQAAAAVEPVGASLSVLANYIGLHKIMSATDYPHSDGFFPGAPQMIRERAHGVKLGRETEFDRAPEARGDSAPRRSGRAHPQLKCQPQHDFTADPCAMSWD
jgi:hypothetical protein